MQYAVIYAICGNMMYYLGRARHTPFARTLTHSPLKRQATTGAPRQSAQIAETVSHRSQAHRPA